MKVQFHRAKNKPLKFSESKRANIIKFVELTSVIKRLKKLGHKVNYGLSQSTKL
ncbi:hypothetical protein ALC57_04038 [Trachymyrmex cornetzi]|uniref:Uncharacterized protein n=1 Tax=Trachymyrmex cornetzi TaxID=471704 RepID=A0A151JF15_9HYME|nr:hypothetical protein ALC57_04038 [Trachymyrmex cornetzi]